MDNRGWVWMLCSCLEQCVYYDVRLWLDWVKWYELVVAVSGR